MRSLLTLLLVGCATDGDVVTMPMDQLPPPTVEVSAVIPGQILTTVVQGLPTGTAVTMRAGPNHLPGACDATIYGECMDVGRPAAQASSVVQRGSAVPGILVPNTLAPGSSVYVQTAGRLPNGVTGVSPVVERRVGCGDGVLIRGETCDDGNVLNGDGCSELCQTAPTPSAITLLTAGSRYGFCFGQCRNELEFLGSTVTLTRSDYMQTTVTGTNTGTLTRTGLGRVAAAMQALSGVRLSPVYGCPDCIDQGEFYFDLQQASGLVSSHRLDPLQVPTEWALANSLRADLTQALTDCTSTLDITPSPFCIPL